nr:hypothetical protein [bacterium]
MKYIIMCGGKYDYFDIPKHLIEVNGERLVDRTIRLLKEQGITDIAISSNDKRFDSCNVPRLEHENNYEVIDGKDYGYWLDAFYPTDEEVCYLFGDVYYSEDAIKTIIENDTDDVLFFGSSIPNRPEYFKKWEEPFAFKVKNQKRFRECINICKEKKDNGETNREPISWELYRVLNGIDINTHEIRDNFIAINDISTDIDRVEDRNKLEEVLNEIKYNNTLL